MIRVKKKIGFKITTACVYKFSGFNIAMTVRCAKKIKRTMASSINSASCESSEALLSVQELIKKPLTSVPQRYITRLHNHEPSSVQDETLSHAIPTLSLKKLIHGGATKTEQEKLNSACKDWGFFQVCNRFLHLSFYVL